MNPLLPFGEVLDAADQLSPEEQETLIDILHHRLSQAGRQRLVGEVAAARQECAAGQCQPTRDVVVIPAQRHEILRLLERLSELAPEVRFG